MKPKSLKEYLLISWLVPMICTALGSCALAFGLSYLDYSNYRRSEQERLAELAPTIGRRIVAELLLGDQGRLAPVVSQLKAEYGLTKLELVDSPSLEPIRSIHANWGLPTGFEGKSVSIERAARSYATFIQLRHFLLAILPSVLMAAIGFLLQRRFLRTYFIHPVEALAETSVGAREADPSWPLEVQAIAQKLANAFSNREQAIFGQVARGIIHDIRTNLHSMSTAVQLVNSSKDSDGRQNRLEKLYAACNRNIPKIKSILDLSLDTSREIAMTPKLADIGETLDQALATLSEMAQHRNVRLDRQMDGKILAVHDPVQLERVFVNIVKNAIEATDAKDSGKIVKVGVREMQNSVAIEIEDSGPGLLDPKSVFRPLKSSKVHGVGLGLFVSRKIVEAHNGRLEPGTSTSLGGAKFTVILSQEANL